MPLSLLEADLIGLFVECLLYGLFIGLGVLAIAILARRLKGKRRRINVALIVCTVLMLGCGTAHLGADLWRVSKALFGEEGRRHKILTDARSSSLLTALTTFGIFSLLGDILITYRCYAVWENWLVLPIPSLFTVFSLASYIQTLINHTYRPYAQTVSWATGLVGFSLAANLSATTLFVWKVWRVAGRAEVFPDAPRKAIASLIESGVLNAAALLAYQISLFLRSRSNIFRLMSNIIVPLMGVTQMLLIVRVKLYADFSASQVPLLSFRAAPGRSTTQDEVGDIMFRGAETEVVEVVLPTFRHGKETALSEREEDEKKQTI